MGNRIKTLVEILNICDKKNRDLLNRYQEFGKARDFLIKKVVEELGEYTEATLLEEGLSVKKLKKYNLLDKNNVVNVQEWKELSIRKTREEVLDLLFIVLSLCRMEKLSVADILEGLWEEEPKTL